MPPLTTLDGLSGLTELAGDLLEIRDNPLMPTCDALGLLERLEGYGGEVCINCNLADPCPPDPSGCSSTHCP